MISISISLRQQRSAKVMRMRSLSKKKKKKLHHQQFLLGSPENIYFFYWTTSMAGCSLERLLQTIKSPLQRPSAFCRLFSTVRSYNQASQATGPRTVLCNTSQLLRAHHGHLTSLNKRSTMIHMNSLIRSVNVSYSYSVLWHCQRCIHSTSSEY